MIFLNSLIKRINTGICAEEKLWALFFVFFSSLSFAQNFDRLGSKDAAKVTGGITFNGIGYAQDGLVIPSREPFTWYASGNITATILDVSLPFTFTYSNQGGQFTQPFNRTAFHPSYKWFKSHIGLISSSYSPYTLSGHLFLGGAIDLTPGKWKISAMGGRLIKPVAYSALDNNIDQFAYRRLGFGIQAGYTASRIGGSITVFKAQDDPSSIPFVPTNAQIKPQDNLVLGAKLKVVPVKSLTAEMEYSLSALTQNRNDEGNFDTTALAIIYPAVSGNSTTGIRNAFKSTLLYKLKNISLGAGFEHVDPGYRTLGGYYFNNDLQNFTVNPAVSLWKNKLNVAANGGFQRNNLAGDKTATTSRLVGSANVSIAPMQGLSLAFTASNFSNFTRNRPAANPFYYQPADTLNFYQVTKSVSGMLAYSFGKSNTVNAFTALYAYNQSVSLSGQLNGLSLTGGGNFSAESPLPVNVHMANAAWLVQFKKMQAVMTIAGNLNHSVIDTLVSDFYGPTAQVQKSLLKKQLNLMAGTTYNLQFQNNTQVGNVVNYRASVAFTPQLKTKKAGSFTLSANANLLQRLPTVSAISKISELNVFFNVGYNF